MMLNNPKRIAVVLGVCIAVTTTLLLWISGRLDGETMVITFVISFLVSALLTFLALEFFIFRQIRKIDSLLPQKKDAPDLGKVQPLDPLTAMDQRVTSFVESKQKEIDQLRKQDAFRKEFIAVVSHELKTPIFAAQGFIHTLLDGAIKDKTVRKKFLKKAAKSLDRLDLLVRDLLTLSQIETGQAKMHFKATDLYTLTEEVFEEFETKANKKKVTLRIDGPVKKVMVYADRQRIIQVMTNLISNALKHTDKDGEVVVTFGRTKTSVITRVTDNGEGIPSEHIHRIFERFYRVDKSRSREKGGTGLGLAIVKHILEGHNSKPEVESTAGKGSVFSFKLPRLKPDEK